MLIATKYEEIYPPLLKDFVFITDNVFSADEILEMESYDNLAQHRMRRFLFSKITPP